MKTNGCFVCEIFTPVILSIDPQDGSCSQGPHADRGPSFPIKLGRGCLIVFDALTVAGPFKIHAR